MIHAVGPVWHGGTHGEPDLLASCYRRALSLANGEGLRSIAFPSISTGVYGYPIERAAPLAVATVREHAGGQHVDRGRDVLLLLGLRSRRLRARTLRVGLVTVNRQVVIGSVAVALAAGAGLAIYLCDRSARTAGACRGRGPRAALVRRCARRRLHATAAAEPARPARRAAAAPVEAAPEPAPAPVEAAPEVGTLRIGADVAGAQVFLDRQFIGAAPVVAENVKPGTHQLNVSAEGFDSFAEPIEVQPGTRDIAVKFREVRLDARVNVIHRHGIGSCRGQLVATAQGIRYDTADKDDQFTTALLDLDTFQVDYLEKNLRLKLKRGKQFNFTDPEGNADRLFVFHRDVEKARERLRRGDQPAGD